MVSADICCTPVGVTPAGRTRTTCLTAVSFSLRLFAVSFCYFGITWARPSLSTIKDEDTLPSAQDPKFYVYLGVAIALVLLGGAFAGLTIALMGQDEIYLQVIATSGDGSEKRNATKVLKLLKRGKHWVLVTLLVGNVITNETLPLVLDRSLGGGYAAAISSTVLVIIFGEIVPQSVCVRYGLPIGAWMSPFVLMLMWIFSPITWPIAKLLDRILGENHGTVYKKAGLKTLVTLHQTMSTTPNERLNEDEVSIIKGVLDLKAKSVGSIMTPMNDVFTLSADAILDEDMMNVIMREGYSRIPIHEPSNKGDFVGMLLVKMLITYDPEDARRVSEFSLATLPETRPETSCLDIINFFQEGKSHMVLVSAFPGEPYGALGVVTLEDVIEELIGEEIIDESDVFIDVHKAIRRIQPAPTHRTRVSKGNIVTDVDAVNVPEGQLIGNDNVTSNGQVAKRTENELNQRYSVTSVDLSRSPRPTTFLLRQRNSLGSNDVHSIRGYTPEIKEQLKNLGPSNAARQPKPSRINTVKIKPAVGKSTEENDPSQSSEMMKDKGKVTSWPAQAQEGRVGDLVGPGKAAKDGVQAVQAGYGTWGRNSHFESETPEAEVDEERQLSGHPADTSQRPERLVLERNLEPLGRLEKKGHDSSSDNIKRIPLGASMSEQLVESGGVKKLVIEMTSSSDDAEDHNVLEDDDGDRNVPSRLQDRDLEESSAPSGSNSRNQRKRMRGRKPKVIKERSESESTPLIKR